MPNCGIYTVPPRRRSGPRSIGYLHYSGFRKTVPIGRPIANTQIYILDANLRPVPVGVIGDLYIGGDGVSRGYLNRPELTAERFHSQSVPAANSACTKPVTLPVICADGNIEFLGRSDQQVKVRGFRIETGEVEVALSQHPAVRQAVVVAWQERSSDAALVAYVVPAQESAKDANAAQLRDFLRQKLPEYMVPSIFVTLEVTALDSQWKSGSQGTAGAIADTSGPACALRCAAHTVGKGTG